MNVKQKVAEYVAYAKNGHENFEIFGKFVLFSSSSGEAWLLDPNEKLALRLVDNFEQLQFTIEETTTKFYVEWPERYQIQDGTFIALRGEKQTKFSNYPAAELNTLFAQIQMTSVLS